MDCIFCKLVSGELPVAKVWENDEFMAILDGYPNLKGMTLVIPKEHHDSYVFDMPEDVAARFYLATKTVAKMLEKAFSISRVAMVMEGMGINHAHIKLYPLHGVTEKFKEMWSSENVWFDQYQGYISTQLGPAMPLEDRQIIAQHIREANGVI